LDSSGATYSAIKTVLPEHSPKNAAGEAALYLAGGELFFQAFNGPFASARAERAGLRDVTMILPAFRQWLLQQHLAPQRFRRHGHYQMYTPGLLR
jgi:hypothetical protein